MNEHTHRHIHTVCIWQCKHFSLVTQAKYFLETAHIHFQEYSKKEDYTFMLTSYSLLSVRRRKLPGLGMWSSGKAFA